jgi:hypothetical protein
MDIMFVVCSRPMIIATTDKTVRHWRQRACTPRPKKVVEDEGARVLEKVRTMVKLNLKQSQEILDVLDEYENKK